MSAASRAAVVDAPIERWLVALRWVVVLVLAVSLPASEHLLALPVQTTYAVSALLVLVLANAVHPALARRVGPTRRAPFLFANVALDVLAIAFVLGSTGGAANPFSAILLVYVALGAALLPLGWALGLAALAAVTFGALFILPEWIFGVAACCAVSEPGQAGFSRHLYGMWVAFALGASLVAFFVSRVRATMEAHARENAALRMRADRADRFAAIGTLAAGTAHELGTPLATIAVLAEELAQDPAYAASREPAAEIARQVDRCRAVLTRMRPGAGAAMPSEPATTDLASTVAAAVQAFRAAHPDLEVELAPAETSEVPVHASELEAAVTVLLDNALAAGHPGGVPLVVRAGAAGGVPFVTVDDEGAGVDADAAARMGEPFYTTKEPGQGMGLGLYVVRTLLEGVGGHLEIARRAPRGTSVRLVFGALHG